ncbi:hypothetical protein COCON_G00013910 [Conger conger]|uniref:Tribbles homolog 2 n=1 Tax=Conger conger TaxID=82655 RepID=A0A9Q1I7I6_CONCO|nr:hypothetical protein COCON_G00013910 [Conger conger]
MDNSGKEKEAIQLMAEADKKVKSSGSFLGGMFGGNHKVEEACDMYARAANMFKMAKNWSAAGSAFCQAARLHMQLQSKHDSATSYVDAGNAYKKADPHEAINCLNAAIDIYTDMGRFTIAAKHHITIAEVYESELVDIEKAIAHYEQAADYYKGEESNSSANKCLLKVASYSAQLEQYQKAIEIYEQVGSNTMDNPLLKYSAKEYLFKASLCHFIVDELNAKLAVEKYEEMFPAFTDSRECKFLKKLLEAHEEQNSEAFTEAVKEFDSISRLDQWLTTMLLRIKKTIQDDAGDLNISRIGKYLLLELIEGDHVFRAAHLHSGEELVCKLFDITRYQESLAAYFCLPAHENINQIVEILLGDTKAYVFFERSHGDMHSFVRSCKKLREDEAARLFYQMASAVAHCHDNGLVLRDVKLRKFVFKYEDRSVVMLDSLEDACVLCGEDDSLSSKHGCPAYVSPEVLSSGGSYSGRPADVWSLGVMLYTMLVGRYPFHDLEPGSLFSKIRRGHFSLPESLTPKARCLIRSILRRDPAQRLTSRDILEHPWLSGSGLGGESREPSDQMVPDVSAGEEARA